MDNGLLMGLYATGLIFSIVFGCFSAIGAAHGTKKIVTISIPVLIVCIIGGVVCGAQYQASKAEYDRQCQVSGDCHTTFH